MDTNVHDRQRVETACTAIVGREGKQRGPSACRHCSAMKGRMPDTGHGGVDAEDVMLRDGSRLRGRAETQQAGGRGGARAHGAGLAWGKGAIWSGAGTTGRCGCTRSWCVLSRRRAPCGKVHSPLPPVPPDTTAGRPAQPGPTPSVSAPAACVSLGWTMVPAGRSWRTRRGALRKARS